MIQWLTDEVFIREMTDKQLLAAYQRTDGETGDATALLAEIEKRDLDI